MPKFKIRATITKTIQADTEAEAHEMFSVLCDGQGEDYEQETIEEQGD